MEEAGSREFHTWRPVCKTAFREQSCQSRRKLPPSTALIIPHSLVPEQSSSVREKILMRPCWLFPCLTISTSLILTSTVLLMTGQ